MLFSNPQSTTPPQKIIGPLVKTSASKIQNCIVTLFITSPRLHPREKQVHLIVKLGFGYGKKTDLEVGKHRHNVIPPSTTYDIKSFVEINKMHKKGFTPRYSRDVLFLKL